MDKLPEHNQPEWTVTELAMALKRTVEGAFARVRVRGEISELKRHGSGHLYMCLKDESAILNAVSWRGTWEKFGKRSAAPFEVEQGIEVICTGRITTYPGRSQYQLIVEGMELAGAGALMALLEKRKAALLAEGLFDSARKKPLPYMPRCIGVITSPTGAVIRDILHRITDRFPLRVVIWPVAVQGAGAAEQITNAIHGFNNMPPELCTPDVIIVARGGGSLEDLWAFNEEVVVRAAAASKIPLISAIGHETDTTLIDYAADKRAPTPTAAAEMAVPVLEDLRLWVMEANRRVLALMQKFMQHKHSLLVAAQRGLIHPRQMLEVKAQRFDDWSERLGLGLVQLLDRKQIELIRAAGKLRPDALLKEIERHAKDAAHLHTLARTGISRTLERKEERLERLSGLLASYHYEKVLKRGFALIRDAKGKLVTAAASVAPGMSLEAEFHDGRRKMKAES